MPHQLDSGISTGHTSSQRPQKVEAWAKCPASAHADQRRRQHRADRAWIDPAVGMAADGAVDRAVVHAGAAADAAQHLAQFAAAATPSGRCRAITTWHASGPSRSPARRGPVDERRVGGDLLARSPSAPAAASAARRPPASAPPSRSTPARCAPCGSDMRQVGVALVGDDDGRAGLGDEEVGAGDADVGGKEFLAQDAARFADQCFGSARSRSGGRWPWRRRNSSATSPSRRWIAGAMMWLGVSPRIWMMYSPRSVSTDIEAGRFEARVEADLLGDHRLALGDDARARLAADAEDDVAGVRAVGAQCTREPARVALRSNASR